MDLIKIMMLGLCFLAATFTANATDALLAPADKARYIHHAYTILAEQYPTLAATNFIPMKISIEPMSPKRTVGQSFFASRESLSNDVITVYFKRLDNLQVTTNSLGAYEQYTGITILINATGTLLNISESTTIQIKGADSRADTDIDHSSTGTHAPQSRQ